MKIVLVGAGYVGLVSGACFSDFGHEVVVVDKDKTKTDQLSRGDMPVYEPGLGDLISQNVDAKRLTFSTELAAASKGSDVVFIAVGTPPRISDGHADLSAVFSVARELAPALERFTVVATKSTVPVGTGEEVERIIRETNERADVAVISNPEFLREGVAIEDFKRPSRIVVGLEDERARDILTDLYRPLSPAPLLFTDRRTAELIKYTANAFLAMKIAFINEVADLCEKIGAEVQDVSRGIGLDRRIGSDFLQAGPGFGGSCFPKDALALTKIAHDAGTALRLVETTIAINDQRKRSMAQKVIAACDGSVRDKTIAILGLTFKPNTDDMREAPSLALIHGLQDAGAHIRAYDPAGMPSASRLTEGVAFGADAYDAADGADALVIITEWSAFRDLDLSRIKYLMADSVLVDLRNAYDAGEVVALGFTYVGIGQAMARQFGVQADAAE